jgi:hypothetical protein
MARDEDFSNYDIQSQDRYISRATRNPPTHFDWETWRKVGQPGAYQAPPGSSAGSFRGVTSGAGAPDYRLTKESHYNEFANAGKIGEAVGEGIGSLFQGVKDLKDAKMNSNQSSSSSGGGSSSGTGTGMASGNRSQSASITGPSNSRAMRRGNNNGSMSVGVDSQWCRVTTTTELCMETWVAQMLGVVRTTTPFSQTTREETKQPSVETTTQGLLTSTVLGHQHRPRQLQGPLHLLHLQLQVEPQPRLHLLHRLRQVVQALLRRHPQAVQALQPRLQAAVVVQAGSASVILQVDQEPHLLRQEAPQHLAQDHNLSVRLDQVPQDKFHPPMEPPLR